MDTITPFTDEEAAAKMMLLGNYYKYHRGSHCFYHWEPIVNGRANGRMTWYDADTMEEISQDEADERWMITQGYYTK